MFNNEEKWESANERERKGMREKDGEKVCEKEKADYKNFEWSKNTVLAGRYENTLWECKMRERDKRQRKRKRKQKESRGIEKKMY